MTQQLQHTTFRFNTKVARVQDGQLFLENGERLASDYTIIATAAQGLVPHIEQASIHWKSCQTFYFTATKRPFPKPFIGLITNKDCLINNIFYHTSLPVQHRGSGELLSVTVVKPHQLSDEALLARVQQELQQECQISGLSFLKRYDIPQALPDLARLQYNTAPTATQLTDQIFLAGDVRLNGSLNAAMLAGEAAALGVVERSH